MQMLKAEIIDPFKRKSKASCSRCSLAYSARDYLILYQSEKLAFFKAKFPPERKKIYCHDCLYKSVAESMGLRNTLDLTMKTLESEEVVITFYRE